MHRATFKKVQPALRQRRSPSRFSKWFSPSWYAKRLTPSWQACIPLALTIVLGWSYAGMTQTPSTLESVSQATAELKVGIDTMWVMIAAMLVFFMNAGFCIA